MDHNNIDIYLQNYNVYIIIILVLALYYSINSILSDPILITQHINRTCTTVILFTSINNYMLHAGGLSLSENTTLKAIEDEIKTLVVSPSFWITVLTSKLQSLTLTPGLSVRGGY